MTAHGRELSFIFGNARLGTADLQGLWSRFIVTGTPGHAWPRFPERQRLDAKGAYPDPSPPSPLCSLTDTL
jgi:hypothetical protein